MEAVRSIHQGFGAVECGAEIGSEGIFVKLASCGVLRGSLSTF